MPHLTLPTVGSKTRLQFAMKRRWAGIYRLLSIILVALDHQLEGVECMNYAEIESHLELGRQLLARGQYGDALSHYHAAVDGDPSNYLTYFKRATVYLALGRSKAALEDLNKVVELKPDFLQARLQRGNVLLKQGRLEEAHIDLEWVLRLDPYNEDANHAYLAIEPLKQDISSAYVLLNDKNYPHAIEVLNRLIHEIPWDPKLREMRSAAYEGMGDITNAIGDLRATTKMRADNTAGFLKLSKLHYQLAEAEESLAMIRECLKLDPDHKQCHTHYKKVKKLVNQLRAMQDFASEGSYAECVEKAKAALQTESEVTMIVHLIKARMCHCLNKGGQADEAIDICTAALDLINDDPNVLCDRADAYLANEQYDDALQDYQKAANIDGNLRRAQEGIEKTQRLIKQSKKRDYYKILGVKRTATKKEILKAYRKLAMKWHPDNFQEGKEKKEAEKKFIDIAAAKEVLTDPEKRQKFDNGEDPLDPESQQGQNFNPFAQHFNPFGGNGGGPFTFRFHFH